MGNEVGIAGGAGANKVGCGADGERPSLPCSRGSWLRSEWLGVVLKDVLSVVESWAWVLGGDMAGDVGPEGVLVP